MRNDLDYRQANRKGVAVAIYGGNKSVMKNVCMQSQQDTQVTGERSYFDHCRIQGTVDYICGGGDQFYDQCELIMEGAGSVISAPSTTSTTKWGYVFSHCTIDRAEAGNGAKMKDKGDYALSRFANMIVSLLLDNLQILLHIFLLSLFHMVMGEQ